MVSSWKRELQKLGGELFDGKVGENAKSNQDKSDTRYR
ncbi:hypothetical protein [uncultured Gammaproteobacteria bacterium]|nr:hypothetical protein [uncultured Gammaproteobacteria bacterium]